MPTFPNPAVLPARRPRALLLCALVLSLYPHPSLAQDPAGLLPLETKVAQDPELGKYPHLQQFVAHIVVPHPRQHLRQADPSLFALLDDAQQLDTSDPQSILLTPPEVDAFFAACVADKLTMLRANGLLARAVRWSNVVLLIDGRDTDAALHARHLSVGLSLPMQHATLFAYIPHPATPPPFLCRFLAVYDRPFTYAYDRNVLNESIVIGADGSPSLPARKVFDDRPPSANLYLVRSDILYPGSAVGFYNIKGVTLAGWKAFAFGAVDAMFVQGDTLTIKGTHWLQKNVPAFERPEQWALLGVHPNPPTRLP